MMRFLFSKRQNGECPVVPEVITLDQLVVKARTDHSSAVSKLSALKAAFESTDFSEAPVEIFQAKEAEIRKCQLAVDDKRSQLDELETAQSKQIELEQAAFVKQQKASRVAEIDIELGRLAERIPELQILLNRLPVEIEALRQRSFSLQRERATLL
jgi:hypothetical protein